MNPPQNLMAIGALLVPMCCSHGANSLLTIKAETRPTIPAALPPGTPYTLIYLLPVGTPPTSTSGSSTYWNIQARVSIDFGSSIWSASSYDLSSGASGVHILSTVTNEANPLQEFILDAEFNSVAFPGGASTLPSSLNDWDLANSGIINIGSIHPALTFASTKENIQSLTLEPVPEPNVSVVLLIASTMILRYRRR